MADLGGPSTPESGHSGGGGGGGGGAREQDRFLPIANIGRIMRKAIPENGKIAKEAKESVQECVSEFISFITSEASDKCQREKRKTINGDDLLWAMGTLGFEDYIEPLKLYLQLYREMEGDGKGSRFVDQSGKRDGAFNGDSGGSWAGILMRTSKQLVFDSNGVKAGAPQAVLDIILSMLTVDTLSRDYSFHKHTLQMFGCSLTCNGKGFRLPVVPNSICADALSKDMPGQSLQHSMDIFYNLYPLVSLKEVFYLLKSL